MIKLVTKSKKHTKITKLPGNPENQLTGWIKTVFSHT